ncbi:MAG: thioredoxin family protein [bacterium]|nr:thioredoxin family protein [bacterium]
MKEILILGPGCYRCQKLYDDVQAAVKEIDIECEVIKVTDIAAIAGFGVMQTPALIIDGELKAAGKLLSKDKIKELLGEK